MSTTRTTCPYCGVGCGVTATTDDANVIAVSGDDDHPANGGRLCVKGTALGETLGIEARLLTPRLEGEQVDWSFALDTLAQKLQHALDTFGPDAIAFYLSGQLLTEDYYVANKLMKGFLGSANVDTNSRLCMSSAVSAHKRAFGEDIVPVTYEDVEQCDLLVLTGSNTAWSHPVLFQRITAAKQNNPDLRVVVIDTRRTQTCDIADLFLQIAPGSDGHLFGGLLAHLTAHDKLDRDYIAAHTEGFEAALSEVHALSPPSVCAATRLESPLLERFYQWFGETERVVTLFSQGINQSATGTDKCNAIINCHLATGRIGKPGAGPFSITGQPNAMGGREVGGLATQLAAHLDFTPAGIDCVQRFWQAPTMATTPGLTATELFEAMDAGTIKFLWVMATNPAVSLPDTNLVKRALQRCDFVVVSDCTAQTDTAAHANLLLPAAGWGEKSGTVTNSERVISRQRALVKAPGKARPDWWAVAQVARRLGFGQAFDYTSPAQIFREHAALSGFENNGKRAFDISALSRLSNTEYDALRPVRWPCTIGTTGEPLHDGRFFTPSGKAQFIALEPTLPDVTEGLIINTGRLRDQWHTMTRTGQVARLARHRDFFHLEVNPADAARLGIGDESVVKVENAHGQIRTLARLSEDLPEGQAFLPIHWSHQFTAMGTANALYPIVVDPVSGQPQSKFTGAVLTPVKIRSWALLLTRSKVPLRGFSYWSRIAVPAGYLVLIADHRTSDALIMALNTLGAMSRAHPALYEDSNTGDLRAVVCNKGRIEHALFIHSQRQQLPDQHWLAGLSDAEALSAAEVLGGSGADQQRCGAMICSCWEVSEPQIKAAITSGALSVESLGERLRCGTQCGSCIPELRQLLREHKAEKSVPTISIAS